jgi:radical SAM superfamily enzyme YgiQ (UPF0313 family)
MPHPATVSRALIAGTQAGGPGPLQAHGGYGVSGRTLLVKLPEPHKPTQKPAFMPPFGLWSIAYNVYRESDFMILDCHLHGMGALALALDGYDPDRVLLSVQFSIQHALYLEAVAMCAGREIIAGGFHASAVDPPAGVRVIKGDGETGLKPGLTFEDIEYPPPMADRLRPYWDKGAPHDLQSKTQRWTPVEFSRGCFRRCGYCGVPRFWGDPRYYSREKISAYLDALVVEGIEEVFIEDDNFIASPGNFRWIIQEMGKRGIWWSTPNGISAGALSMHVDGLAASGCWRVALPFETGTRSTARLMGLGNKWLEQVDALTLVERLKSEGILTCGFFIIGYPGETLEDMQATLDYANSLPLDQRNVYIATPYPGTPLYDKCLEAGYLTSQPPDLYTDLLYTRGLISTPDWTPEDVEALKKRDRDAAIARKEAACKVNVTE